MERQEPSRAVVRSLPPAKPGGCRREETSPSLLSFYMWSICLGEWRKELVLSWPLYLTQLHESDPRQSPLSRSVVPFISVALASADNSQYLLSNDYVSDTRQLLYISLPNLLYVVNTIVILHFQLKKLGLNNLFKAIQIRHKI